MRQERTNASRMAWLGFERTEIFGLWPRFRGNIGRGHFATSLQNCGPEYLAEASFEPDSGSVEQEIKFAHDYAEGEKAKSEWMWKRLQEVERELDRLRAGRLDLHERHPKRRKFIDNYFIRQYEHLLVAMAHHAVPRADEKKGICAVCGLYVSDRVHQMKFIKRHNDGYEPRIVHLAGLTKDDVDE